MDVICEIINDSKFLYDTKYMHYEESKISNIKNNTKKIDKKNLILLLEKIKEDEIIVLFNGFCISDDIELVKILKEKISDKIDYNAIYIMTVYFGSVSVFKLLFDKDKIKNPEQFLIDLCINPNNEIFRFVVEFYNIDINKNVLIKEDDDLEEYNYFSEIMINCYEKNSNEIIKIIDFLFSRGINDEYLLKGWSFVDTFNIFIFICEKYVEKNGKEKFKKLLENKDKKSNNILENCCKNGVSWLNFLEEQYDIKFDNINKLFIPELKKKSYCDEVVKWLENRNIKIKLELNIEKMIEKFDTLSSGSGDLVERYKHFLQMEKLDEDIKKTIDNIRNEKFELKEESDELELIKRIITVVSNFEEKKKKFGEIKEKIDNKKKIFREKEKEEEKLHNYEITEEHKKELEKIFSEIKTLKDIVELEKIKDKDKFIRNIKFKRLIKIIPELKEFLQMVGLENIKREIFTHICYFVNRNEINKELMNIAIFGSPGSGKTMLGQIISKIYLNLGFLQNDKIIFAKKNDFEGKYIGHSIPKTEKIIQSALGGVLFIDEVYSLSSGNNRDSFSKECIDTINRNLTEHQGEFLCIIAGYKNEVEKCFFDINKGLSRRFPIRYTINDYSDKELKEIFLQKKGEYEIACSEGFLDIFFKENKNSFKFNGSDMEILMQFAKFCASERTMGNIKNDYLITKEDIERAYLNFTKNREINKNEEYLTMFL